MKQFKQWLGSYLNDNEIPAPCETESDRSLWYAAGEMAQRRVRMVIDSSLCEIRALQNFHSEITAQQLARIIELEGEIIKLKEGTK